MHDLRSAVAAWRRAFEGEHELDHEQLDELESHVLDSAEGLRATGLSDEEAVLVAAHRLGFGAELRDEYAKVHPDAGWARRVQWMLAGYLGLSGLVLLARLLAASGATALTSGLSGPRAAACVLALTIVCFLALAWTLSLLLRRGDALAPRIRAGVARVAASRCGPAKAFVVALATFALVGFTAEVVAGRAVAHSFSRAPVLFGLGEAGRPRMFELVSYADLVAMLLVPALAAAFVVTAERRRIAGPATRTGAAG